MISIIICSKHTSIDAVLNENIAKTVGCEYEIVHIDNSQGQHSIFQAYNIGVERSKGDILCFMHDDILFHSTGWGGKVEEYLSDRTIGMLGVAGMHIIPELSDARMIKGFVAHSLIRYATLEQAPRDILLKQRHKETGMLEEVAALDGLWFCIPRNMFSDIRFDDETFHDFHLYDIDISMQVLQTGKKVMICDDVILEHASIGVFSQAFSYNLQLFLRKWHDKLPVLRGISMSSDELQKRTTKAVKTLEKRIRKDAVVIQVIDKLRNGITSFTPAERHCIDRSIELYMKYQYLNTASKAKAFAMLKEFLKERNHSLILYIKVFFKFLAYGLMK